MFIPKAFKYFICSVSFFYFLYIILFIFLNIHSHASKDTKDISIVQRIKSVTNCTDNVSRHEFSKRGDFWVLYNYVISSRRFKCEESVTYVTNSDYTMLDNLIPVLNRWLGPISVALHAPGSDFKSALESVLYLRSCVPLMKEYVTFHIYFPDGHFPEEIPSHNEVMRMTYNCSLRPPFQTISRNRTYTAKYRLIYPINVGRNVASSMAETYYVLISDIELYPSPDIISRFLEMSGLLNQKILKYYPAVFALHDFEIQSGLEIPNTKTELQRLLKTGKVIPFRKNLCPLCHEVPKTAEWIETKENKNLKVFHVAKRTGRYRFWEPFYIGTKNEPLFDERLSWEGMQDKMIQAHIMCVLGYSYLILDNAFLVHRPGFKKSSTKLWRYMKQTNETIKNIILPEIAQVYGNKSECQCCKSLYAPQEVLMS